MMRLQCTQDLDFETLDAMGHWATMEELLVRSGYFSFASFRKHREDVQNKSRSSQPSDLTFATKFVTVYLFSKVKGSHPRPISA